MQEKEKNHTRTLLHAGFENIHTPPSLTLDTVSLLPRVSSRSDALFTYMDTPRERWRAEEQDEREVNGRETGVHPESTHPSIHPSNQPAFSSAHVFSFCLSHSGRPIPWNLSSAAPIWALPCPPCSALTRSPSLASLPVSHLCYFARPSPLSLSLCSIMALHSRTRPS